MDYGPRNKTVEVNVSESTNRHRDFLLLPLQNAHAQLALGAEDDFEFRLDLGLTLFQRQPEPLQYGGRQENDLHHGHAVADADARSTAKGEIGVWGNALHAAWSESLRVELFRLLEVVRIAVNDIRGHEHPGALAERVAA